MNAAKLALLPCAGEFIAHAQRDYPREACGLVCVINGEKVYVPCENKSAGKSQFQIDHKELAAAEAKGEIVALLHSHPDGGAEPSEADMVMCELSELPWFILSIHKEEGELVPVDVRMIEPSGYQAPLVGRTFHHGILDCFTLIKDYYSREIGIDIPEFEREDQWWVKGKDLYMKNFKRAGFQIATGSGPSVHDVVLMQIRSPVANHAGIYIGDTKILHHLYGRLSSRDVYGGYLQDAARLILRHRSLK